MKDFIIDTNSSYPSSYTSANSLLPNQSTLVHPTLPTETAPTTTSDFINYGHHFDYSNHLLYPDPYIMSHEPDLPLPHGPSGKKARKNNQKEQPSRCFSADVLQQDDFPSSSSSSPIIKTETVSSPSSSPASSYSFFSYSTAIESLPSTSATTNTTTLSQQHQRLQQLQYQHLQLQQLALGSSLSSSVTSTTSTASSISTSSSSTSAASSISSPILTPSIYHQVIKEMESELDHLNDELHILTVLMDGLKTTFLETDGFYRTNPSGSLRLSQPQQHVREMEKERRIAYDNLVQDIANVGRKFEILLTKLDRLRRMEHIANQQNQPQPQ
ncbi:unnamed protein product [Cunninghamella blakesleeana]